MRLLVVLCMIAAPATALPGHEVRVREEQGDLLCDVRASDTSVRILVEAIGAQLGRQIIGFEELREIPRVSVHLEGRPLAQGLRYILGAAGLRARVTATEIAVEREIEPHASSKDLNDAAEMAYLAALVRFPDHPEGAQARLTLGELEEQRGRMERAAQHYDYLAEEYRDSELVPEALWRAGRAWMQSQGFDAARVRFTELTNMRRPHAHHAGARLALANCLARLGDHRQALFVLEALDRAYPAESDSQTAERLMVRARAEVGSGSHMAALRSLDHACALNAEYLLSLDAMELRAKALELAGRPGDAAIAWIAFSQDERTSTARRALKEAARLALAAEDQELAVVFVHGLAAQRGFGDELIGELVQARARLGLEAPSLQAVTALENLQRGEALLADKLVDAALTSLQGALARHAELEDRERGRLASALASARMQIGDVEGALEVLRLLVPSLESSELRRGLYVLAGEWLESVGLYEQAVDAYGGKL